MKLRRHTYLRWYITEAHRAANNATKTHIQIDREGWKVCLNRLTAYLLLSKGFRSVLKDTACSRDAVH